jgi:hypothetical protein
MNGDGMKNCDSMAGNKKKNNRHGGLFFYERKKGEGMLNLRSERFSCYEEHTKTTYTTYYNHT